MEVKQYAIVLVNLDPTIGSEIKKTRPCAVVSPDEMNRHLRTIVIAPLTTNLKKYPTRVSMKHNGKQGMIAIDQIRTIDKKRIVKVYQELTKKEIEECKKVIKEAFVD